MSANHQVMPIDAPQFSEKANNNEPAMWTLFFINKDGQPIQGILIRIDQLSSVYDAIGKEDTYISDFDGRIQLKDLPPGQSIDIYHYDTEMGIKRIAKPL